MIFRWKAKVKKLEKDVDRHKFGSTQMLERNEQLIKELENVKLQNITLREQLTKLETDLQDAHVCIHLLIIIVTINALFLQQCSLFPSTMSQTR